MLPDRRSQAVWSGTVSPGSLAAPWGQLLAATNSCQDQEVTFEPRGLSSIPLNSLSKRVWGANRAKVCVLRRAAHVQTPAPSPAGGVLCVCGVSSGCHGLTLSLRVVLARLRPPSASLPPPRVLAAVAGACARQHGPPCCVASAPRHQAQAPAVVCSQARARCVTVLGHGCQVVAQVGQSSPCLRFLNFVI